MQHHIVLCSIDLGAAETVISFEELRDYKKIGSPFSIPKAALALLKTAGITFGELALLKIFRRDYNKKCRVCADFRL